ncbi:microtubule nucleation by interphase microtubule organizing center [Fragilaria crotonensis]|nr:microtubule nucleation by interphase microtubule organizing center [Fragilaria crotonensis]
MKKAPTAAANRAALARRRQRVGTGTTDIDQYFERQAKEEKNFAFSIPSDAVRETEAFLTDPTPTKSNSAVASVTAISFDFVEEESHQQSPTLVENQQAIANKQLIQSSRRVSKAIRVGKPLQPQQLSERLANTGEKDSSDTMPPSEEEYVEDPEPTVDDSEVLDSTSLSRESLVALKAFPDNISINVEERDATCLAELTGSGLGAACETFEIHPKSGNVVRYGQPVMIFSRTAKAYLGVRTKSRNEQNGVSFELGFFRKQVSDVETWTILHGDRKLLIGSAARSVKAPLGRTVAVRVGEPIVLRNSFIGGLLSVTRDVDLSLVTHAYDSNADSRDALLDRALQHYELYPSKTELFQFWHSYTPPCPNWTYRHEEVKDNGGATTQSVTQFSPRDQEKVLLDAVIGSLMGLECNLIRRFRDGFRIVAAVDLSLRNLVEKILPIASAYYVVKSFLRCHQPGYEYGSVMQALCEEIDVILGEYLRSIETLEIKYRCVEGAKLTMNHAFVELQQLGSSIELLQHVVKCSEGKTGGSLLNTIRELQMTKLAGDSHKQALFKRLLSKASVPWMRMLSRWLVSGDIDDQCGEFMIATKASTRKKVSGDNWNSVFSVKDVHVFRGAIASNILEALVLTTGKYWNAVRQCERVSTKDSHDESDVSHVLRYTGDPSALSSYVESAHKRASSDLLQLLLGEFQVESSLLTVKRYFLLDQGDFLVHFMDTAESELSKLTEDVSLGRTQHCLNMALQLTDPIGADTSGNTSLKRVRQPLTSQSIRCYFADESLDVMLGVREGEPKTPSRSPYGQVTGLTGMLAFSLDFAEVPFPTSLLLSNRNISNYQILFRHIFYAKHIEQRLVGVWLQNQMMKEFQSIRSLLGSTFSLRHRMLHFIQNFIYYMMLEVIEPNWLSMMKEIRKQESADDLINLHNKFLHRTMEDCLLTNPALFKSLAKIMSTCLTFSEQMKRFVETTGIAREKKMAKIKREGSGRRKQPVEGATGSKGVTVRGTEREEHQARRQKQASVIERELKNDTFQRMVKRHEEVFDDNVDDFMAKLRTKVGHQSQITNLCIRLDYNGFISAHSSRS